VVVEEKAWEEKGKRRLKVDDQGQCYTGSDVHEECLKQG